jgi:hypothetical protein
LPFAQAASVLEEAFRLPAAVTSLLRRTQQIGERFQVEQKQQRMQAMALPQVWESPILRHADKRIGVAFDGALMNVRDEGWKEVKIGCVFAVDAALYQGHAALIAHELARAAVHTPTHQEVLTRIAGYFATNAKRMNYREQREALWPIGSGVIESAAKQFKARLCGSGMRWSRKGAEHIVALRSAVISHNYNQRYDAQPTLPLN